MAVPISLWALVLFFLWPLILAFGVGRTVHERGENRWTRGSWVALALVLAFLVWALW